ncbi:ankyrin repeat domain-containing protein [Zooshikella ganghwensis]|uniref:Ankyrin repeat domain-containing protein n=1 Tax=Zooshikella ganghwensis TaxID=202772 RepID=A0A4P9VGQ6_9GAMM|nr:ankyrin repeat domain-containing protein [Zooshikella ganghwensis]RDH41544.1 ankyrin repeat domain-containing protein [Zooshikella ganghwensis]
MMLKKIKLGAVLVLLCVLFSGCATQSHDRNEEDKKDIAFLKAHINKGGNLETKDEKGWTFLHRAAANGRIRVVEFLINNGAKVDTRDTRERTAFILATRFNEFETMKLLLKNDADINAAMADGLNALISSSALDHIEAVEFLINNGANIEAKMENNATALQIAVLKGRSSVVKLLLEKGANIETKAFEKEVTPLTTAAVAGEKYIAYLLIKKELILKLKMLITGRHY